MFGTQNRSTYRYTDGYPKFEGQPRSFVGEFTVNDPIDEQIERLFLNNDDAVIVLQESSANDKLKQRHQQNADVNKRREKREQQAALTQAQNSFIIPPQQMRSGRRSRSLTREQDMQPRGIQVIEEKNAYRPASVILINRDRVKPTTEQQPGPYKERRSLSLTREQQHVQPQRGIQVIENPTMNAGQGREAFKDTFNLPMPIPTITVSKEEKLTEYNVVHHKAHGGKRSRSLTREQEEPRGIQVVEDGAAYSEENVIPIVTRQNRLLPAAPPLVAEYHALQTPFKPKDWRISYEEELKLLRKKQFLDKPGTGGSERPPTSRYAFEMVENPQLLAPPRDSFIQSPPPLPQQQEDDFTVVQYPHADGLSVGAPDTPQQQQQLDIKVGSLLQQMWMPTNSYYSHIMQQVESEPIRGRPRERVIPDSSMYNKKQSQSLHQQQRKDFSQQLLQQQQSIQQQQVPTVVKAEQSPQGVTTDNQRSSRLSNDSVQMQNIDANAVQPKTKGVVIISLPEDKSQWEKDKASQQQTNNHSPHRHKQRKRHHHHHKTDKEQHNTPQTTNNSNSTSSNAKTSLNSAVHKGVSYDNVALHATKMTINTLAERRYRDDMAQLENICAANYSKASHYQPSPRSLVPPAPATSLLPRKHQHQQQHHQQYADPYNSTPPQLTVSSQSTVASSHITDVKQPSVLKEIFI